MITTSFVSVSRYQSRNTKILSHLHSLLTYLMTNLSEMVCAAFDCNISLLHQVRVGGLREMDLQVDKYMQGCLLHFQHGLCLGSL